MIEVIEAPKVDTSDDGIARQLADLVIDALEAGEDVTIYTARDLADHQAVGIDGVTPKILERYHDHLRAHLGDDVVSALLAREAGAAN